jgi:hypothetical protein
LRPCSTNGVSTNSRHDGGDEAHREHDPEQRADAGNALFGIGQIAAMDGDATFHPWHEQR